MAQNTAIAHRNLVMRCLAGLALMALCLFGMVAASTSADARGRGRGRGVYRGRGRGRGFGRGYGIYVAPPVYVAPRGCYWSRRWQRTICPY